MSSLLLWDSVSQVTTSLVGEVGEGADICVFSARRSRSRDKKCSSGIGITKTFRALVGTEGTEAFGVAFGRLGDFGSWPRRCSAKCIKVLKSKSKSSQRKRKTKQTLHHSEN